jgi:hypothetical protein
MTPNRPEHADYTVAVPGAPGFTVERVLRGYAYPVNGNVHNPTPHYMSPRRGPLLAHAQQSDARALYSA